MKIDTTSKAQMTGKIGKLDFIKILIKISSKFCTMLITTKKVKRQPTQSNKGLTSIIHKET